MRKSLYTIGVVFFIVNVLLSAILWLSFRDSYYDMTYERLGTVEMMGMHEVDLQEATETLLGYIKGSRDTLDLQVEVAGEPVEMFNAREKAHMVDVRNLYAGAVKFRSISAIFIATMLMISLGCGDYLDLELNRNVLRNALLMLMFVLVGLGLAIFADFDGFWRFFHQLVFRNDLWLLNPATDRLILMVPLEFFMGLVYRIFFTAILILLFFVLVYVCLDWMVKHDSYRSIRA